MHLQGDWVVNRYQSDQPLSLDMNFEAINYYLEEKNFKYLRFKILNFLLYLYKYRTLLTDINILVV